MLVEEVQAETKRLIAECCERQGLTLVAVETDEDHIHVFVSTPPRFSPTLIANLLKGYTSRFATRKNILISKRCAERTIFGQVPPMSARLARSQPKPSHAISWKIKASSRFLPTRWNGVGIPARFVKTLFLLARYAILQRQTCVRILGNEESEKSMPEVELERIGPYTILDLVSKSSTSSFYLSKYGKKDVTIKRLNIPLSSSEAKEAFQKRAAQLKKLKHRSILDTQKFDFDGDYGYLVLERRDGETLRQHFASDILHAPADIRPILSPVAEALHYAHVQNTLHTNLYPGSLSVDARKNPFITEFSLSTPEIDT